MEGCLNWGWGPIFPGCGGTGGVKRGRRPSLPGLCSLYAPQPRAIGPWDWGFHTVRGGVDPGELDFRTGVGVVEMWNDVCTRNGAQSSPGGRTKRRGPILPVLCLLCSLYATSQLATSPWDWGFHTVRGGVDPGEFEFRTRVVGVVEIWKI